MTVAVALCPPRAVDGSIGERGVAREAGRRIERERTIRVQAQRSRRSPQRLVTTAAVTGPSGSVTPANTPGAAIDSGTSSAVVYERLTTPVGAIVHGVDDDGHRRRVAEVVSRIAQSISERVGAVEVGTRRVREIAILTKASACHGSDRQEQWRPRCCQGRRDCRWCARRCRRRSASCPRSWCRSQGSRPGCANAGAALSVAEQYAGNDDQRAM